MATKRFIGGIQAKVLASIVKWEGDVGYCTRAHILNDVYAIPLKRRDRKSMKRRVKPVESMSISRAISGLVRQSMVSEKASEVYCSTPAGQKYVNGFSDLRPPSRTVAC